jgi:hypothetical protein
MSWIDRLRGKPKDLPLSDREQKIEKIRRRVQDEDYSISEYVPDEALAEAAEDREAMGEDFEYPTEPIPTLDESLDPEWLEEKLAECRREMKAAEKKRIKEMQEKFPDADIDWSREYGQVIGIPGVCFTQDNRYFSGQGKEVFLDDAEPADPEK